jgi:hypothetical protein
MMPVVEYPGVVKEFVGFFSRDLSYHQVKRLKQCLTGLITESKPTVSGIASRMVASMDQSSPNRFLTLYSWEEEGVNGRRLELLQSMEGMGWRRDGVIAVDDTLLSKAGRRMPVAGKLFDHSSGRFVHAQCLVASHYVDRGKDYLEFREHFEHGSGEAAVHGFKTKVELTMELVDECEKLGCPAENYAFDVWYLSKKLSRHIQSHGKGWVRRLKSNRIIHAEDGRMGIREWGEDGAEGGL